MSVESHNILTDYFNVFNNELSTFMEPLGRNSELEGSYIHVNSRVRWARGDSDLDEEDDYMTDEGECQDEEDDLSLIHI